MVLGRENPLAPSRDKHGSSLKERGDIEFPQIPTDSGYMRQP